MIFFIHNSEIQRVKHSTEARLVAHADEIVSETLDHRRGLGCLDRCAVFGNQDRLLGLHEHTAVRLAARKA